MEALHRHVRIIRRVFPGAEAGVFGSRTTGLALPHSDWDLVVNNTGGMHP